MRHDNHEMYIRGMDAITIVSAYLLWLLLRTATSALSVSAGLVPEKRWVRRSNFFARRTRRLIPGNTTALRGYVARSITQFITRQMVRVWGGLRCG